MFYDKLDKIMLQFHLKNKDLAAATSLSQSTISKLRRGLCLPSADSSVYKTLFYGLSSLLSANQIMDFEYKHMISWDYENFSSWICEDSSAPLTKFPSCLCNLMELFKIKNNALAAALNVDSSLISKYRTGKRTPSLDHDIVKKIASYFAELALESNHAEELLRLPGANNKTIMDANHQPAVDGEQKTAMDREALTGAILAWMTQDKLDTLLADRIFNVMEDFTSPVIDFRTISQLVESVDLPYQDVIKNSGNEGLRKQVSLFLSLCAKSKEKLHLKLFSNQGMDWMTEDLSFFHTWKTLMLAVLEGGHKITIIHNIQRTDSESFSAIEGWVPLHLSGNIESYYHALSPSPSFTNTIFISVDHFGLYGNGLIGMEEDTEFFFTKNQDTLRRLEGAFDALIRDSSPLLKSLTIEELNGILEGVEFDNERPASSIYIMQNKLPIWHMDGELLEEILAQNKIDEEEKALITSFVERTRAFYRNILRRHRIFEYFYIEEDIPAHKFTLDCIHSNPHQPIYYNKDQYQRHLGNIASTLKKFQGYHISILDSPMHDKIKLLQLDSRSIYVIKHKYPLSAIRYENEILVKQFQKYIFMKAKSSINSMDDYDRVIGICDNPFERESP